jgi:hypothetical protein
MLFYITIIQVHIPTGKLLVVLNTHCLTILYKKVTRCLTAEAWHDKYFVDMLSGHNTVPGQWYDI